MKQPTQTKTSAEPKKKGGVSKVKLAVGAAGLLLFIVGVKRTYQMDSGAKAGRTEKRGEP